MIVTADTNLFVYIADDREPQKQALAAMVFRALAERRAPIALQVVGELQNALRRRLRMPPWLAAQSARNLLTAFAPFPYMQPAVDAALAQMAAGRLSYWDALLLATCDANGVEVLLTEDMQHGGRYRGVQIVNPFGEDGLSEGARRALA